MEFSVKYIVEMDSRLAKSFKESGFKIKSEVQYIFESILLELDLNNPNEIKDRLYAFREKARNSASDSEKDTFQRALDKFLKKLEDAGIDPETGRKKTNSRSFDDSEMRRRRQEAEDRERANYQSRKRSSQSFKVIFVGHYQDEKSDKVWGWGVKDETIYQFWGRRGKTPSLKTLPDTPANRTKLKKTAQQKENKGYEKQTSQDYLDWLQKVLDTEPRFTESVDIFGYRFGLFG